MVLFWYFGVYTKKKLSKKVVVRRHFKRNRSLSHTHIPERPKNTTQPETRVRLVFLC